MQGNNSRSVAPLNPISNNNNFDTHIENSLENTVGKGENAGQQYFSFSRVIFYSMKEFKILKSNYLLSANAFKLAD